MERGLHHTAHSAGQLPHCCAKRTPAPRPPTCVNPSRLHLPAAAAVSRALPQRAVQGCHKHEGSGRRIEPQRQQVAGQQSDQAAGLQATEGTSRKVHERQGAVAHHWQARRHWWRAGCMHTAPEEHASAVAAVLPAPAARLTLHSSTPSWLASTEGGATPPLAAAPKASPLKSDA